MKYRELNSVKQVVSKPTLINFNLKEPRVMSLSLVRKPLS